MKLSGESDVETMRGNEISTADKVHWYLSGFRSDRKRTRETTKIRTAQKKQGGETTHSECLKLKHESGYLGNREEFYWRNASRGHGNATNKTHKVLSEGRREEIVDSQSIRRSIKFRDK